MWFRNLLAYRLTQAIDLKPETIEAAISTKRARPCTSLEFSTYGFAAPIGKGDNAPLAHASHGFVLLACRKEERILPGSVVRDALKEKVEQIEADQCRKVYKKERDQLRDDIIQAFLPRAFIRQSTTFAAIDAERGLVLVDTSSPARAEDLLSTLRECLGSLPVRPMAVKITPSATMTEWLKRQQAAEGFTALSDAVLADTQEDGGRITATHEDMASDEIQQHLSAGKQVTQLALAWQEKLSFVLNDRMQIKRLRFEDLLQDQAEADGGDDALGQFDASFVLMMLTMRQLVPALIDALGGEETPTGI